MCSYIIRVRCILLYILWCIHVNFDHTWTCLVVNMLNKWKYKEHSWTCLLIYCSKNEKRIQSQRKLLYMTILDERIQDYEVLNRINKLDQIWMNPTRWEWEKNEKMIHVRNYSCRGNIRFICSEITLTQKKSENISRYLRLWRDEEKASAGHFP